MAEYISFKVKKWDYNAKAPLTNTHTDVLLSFNPLRKQGVKEAQGIVFTWRLVLQGEGLEILYYATEEMVIIPNKNLSNGELLEIVFTTYNNSNSELAERNIKVGLDAGYPVFHQIPIDLKELRSVLEM